MYWKRRKQSVLIPTESIRHCFTEAGAYQQPNYRAFKTLSELCMTKKPMPINESDYDEKKRPFDDVIRQILKAKPTHRNTDKLTKPSCVRKQASALPRSAAQCLRFRMSRVAVKRRKHRSRNESAHRHFRVDRSLPKRQ